MHPGQPLTGWGDGPRPDDGSPSYPAYPGPPETAAHDPGGYPQPAGPYGYPPAPGPYGYPPAPGPYGYPGVPQGGGRPGTLTASAVLGYITAGLLMIAALLLFTGASIINSVDNSSDGFDLSNFTAELTFDGFVDLLAAGLLIAGAVMMSGRRPTGRALYSVGGALVLVEAIYWLGRWGSRLPDVGGLTFDALLLSALAVIGLSLAWTPTGSSWLNTSDTPPPPHGGQQYGPPPPYGPPGPPYGG
ncbi:MAG: hypothetical protein QOI10_3709 [Solirubrobacterales bacterium]|nr:hypothetical protein [Solirubrobacterales bacterium]